MNRDLVRDGREGGGESEGGGEGGGEEGGEGGGEREEGGWDGERVRGVGRGFGGRKREGQRGGGGQAAQTLNTQTTHTVTDTHMHVHVRTLIVYNTCSSKRLVPNEVRVELRVSEVRVHCLQVGVLDVLLVKVDQGVKKLVHFGHHDLGGVPRAVLRYLASWGQQNHDTGCDIYHCWWRLPK